MRSSWFSVFPHGCNEAVAPPGDGFDVFASVRAIAQHLPKIEDMAGQIAFLDKDTRPDSIQQLFLLDDVPRPLDQRSEEHTSELQSHHDLVCRLLLEKKKTT